MLKQNAIIVADHISMHNVEPHDEIMDQVAEMGIILAYDGMIVEI